MSKVRVLVPVKRVIDAAVKPRVNKAQTGIETQGVKFAINPFCDIALEEAVRLRERHKAQVENIHAASIGNPKSADVLRTAMAKGADDSTLVNVGDNTVEPLAVAKMLAKLVEKRQSNLVLLGKQAIDQDSNQTAQILAGLLNWPQATNASKIELNDDGTVTVSREIDGGEEVVKAKLPLVVSADLRLNEPRYASLPNIMKAKKKPLETITAESLEVDIKPRLETVRVVEPPARKPGVKVESAGEFVERLREAGVV